MDTQSTIKICDGIYIGDESSSRDEQLILPAHITLIVNLTDLPNYYEHYDIRYITQQWPLEEFWDVIKGIEGVREEGQSALIHGGRNLDQPVTVVTVYLMNRYAMRYKERFRWSLFKTIQYLESKVQGLMFSLESFQLLKREELKLFRKEIRLSYNWELRCEDNEQLVLRNTFLNSKPKQKCMITPPSKPANKKKRRISWRITPSIAQQKRTANVQSRSASLRRQVMQSVRKIINSKQTLSKHSTEISLTHKESLAPTLTKHKSSYMFASLPPLQNMEKIHQIPIVTLQLSQIKGFDNKQANVKKKAKTQINEQNHVEMNRHVKYNEMTSHYRGILSTQNIVSESAQKMKRRQQIDKRVENPSSRSTILLR